MRSILVLFLEANASPLFIPLHYRPQWCMELDLSHIWLIKGAKGADLYKQEWKFKTHEQRGLFQKIRSNSLLFVLPMTTCILLPIQTFGVTQLCDEGKLGEVHAGLWQKTPLERNLGGKKDNITKTASQGNSSVFIVSDGGGEPAGRWRFIQTSTDEDRVNKAQVLPPAQVTAIWIVLSPASSSNKYSKS